MVIRNLLRCRPPLSFKTTKRNVRTASRVKVDKQARDDSREHERVSASLPVGDPIDPSTSPRIQRLKSRTLNYDDFDDDRDGSLGSEVGVFGVQSDLVPLNQRKHELDQPLRKDIDKLRFNKLQFC